MDNKHMLLIKRVLQLLKENEKISQDEVAKRIGISSSYLSKAKNDSKIAKKIEGKILKLIEECNGRYDPNKKALFDKDGNEYLLQPEGIQPKSIIHGLDFRLLKEHLSKSKNIKILSTWGGESYNKLIDLTEKIPRFWAIVDKIQVLILHPNSQATRLRSQGRGIDEERGFHRIKEDLLEITGLKKSYKKKIEVRLFDELPSVKLIIFDELTILGHYLFQVPSRTSHHIQIVPKNEPRFNAELNTHFENIWNRGIPFDFDKAEEKFEKWKFPTYKKHNADRYKKLKGVYYLYIPKENTIHEAYRHCNFASPISVNILEIKEEEEEINYVDEQEKTSMGKLICRMKCALFGNEEEFTGKIVNRELINPNYLAIWLSNKNRDKFINLLFSLNDIGAIFGVATMTNNYFSKTGGSLAVLFQEKGSEYGNLKSEVIGLEMIGDTHAMNLSGKILSYLIPRNKSILNTVSRWENLPEATEWAGVYKVYACNYGKEGMRVTVGALEIYNFGLVRYKNNKYDGNNGVGHIKNSGANLYIYLMNERSKNPRKGLFILYKDGRAIPNKESEQFLIGVSASTTWTQDPSAAKIVAVRQPQGSYDEIIPERVGIKDLPDNLKNELVDESGLPNLIRAGKA